MFAVTLANNEGKFILFDFGKHNFLFFDGEIFLGYVAGSFKDFDDIRGPRDFLSVDHFSMYSMNLDKISRISTQ